MKKSLLIAFCVLLALIPSVYAMRTDLTLESERTIATVTFAQDSYSVPINTTIDMNIWVYDVQKCSGWQVCVYYDKSIATGVKVTEGPFLKQVTRTFLLVSIKNNYNSTHGRVMVACVRLGMSATASGSGLLATLQFKTVGCGMTLLHLGNVLLADEKWPSQPIPVTSIDSLLSVT